MRFELRVSGFELLIHLLVYFITIYQSILQSFILNHREHRVRHSTCPGNGSYTKNICFFVGSCLRELVPSYARIFVFDLSSFIILLFSCQLSVIGCHSPSHIPKTHPLSSRLRVFVFDLSYSLFFYFVTCYQFQRLAPCYLQLPAYCQCSLRLFFQSLPLIFPSSHALIFPHSPLRELVPSYFRAFVFHSISQHCKFANFQAMDVLLIE